MDDDDGNGVTGDSSIGVADEVEEEGDGSGGAFPDAASFCLTLSLSPSLMNCEQYCCTLMADDGVEASDEGDDNVPQSEAEPGLFRSVEGCGC